MYPQGGVKLKATLKLIILLLCCLFFTFGCYSTKSTDEDSANMLTAGMIKSKVIKGRTSQKEVLKIFGAPNVINKTASGLETWTYDRQTYDSNSSANGCLGLYGGSNALGMGAVSQSTSSSGSRSITLQIEFDSNDIVKDYSYESRKF